MDKKLVEELLKKTPKPTFNEVVTHPGGGAPLFACDQDGNPVSYEEYLAGKADPFEYPAVPFSFMAGVRKSAEVTTHKRRGIFFRGDGFHIPPFDPFHDHLTTLILKDSRVKARLICQRAEEVLNQIRRNMGIPVKKDKGYMDGVYVDTALLGAGEIVVTNCPAFKRNIPGITKHW